MSSFTYGMTCLNSEAARPRIFFVRVFDHVFAMVFQIWNCTFQGRNLVFQGRNWILGSELDFLFVKVFLRPRPNP